MFDQLALICETEEEQERLALHLNITGKDQVTAIGLNAEGALIRNVACLYFDYSTWPMEYELLRYLEGWNWHQERYGIGLSHFGKHVSDAVEINNFREHYKVLQEVVTVQHTNPVIKDSRRYHYVIFDTARDYGTTLKFIRRLTLDQAEVYLKTLTAGALQK